MMGQHVSHHLYENLFPQPLQCHGCFGPQKKIGGSLKQCLKLTVASATSKAFPKWKDPLCKHQFSSASAVGFQEGDVFFATLSFNEGVNFWHKWHLDVPGSQHMVSKWLISPPYKWSFCWGEIAHLHPITFDPYLFQRFPSQTGHPGSFCSVLFWGQETFQSNWISTADGQGYGFIQQFPIWRDVTLSLCS